MCDTLLALGNEESTSYLFGSALPMPRMGVEAPTCSSSKPPTIAVHVWSKTHRPASRQLVQGMLVVNKPAFDLEQSSLSASTKRGAQQVT